MNKKYFKKYSWVLILSTSILAPMTLASCNHNVAKKEDKTQSDSSNLSNKTNKSDPNDHLKDKDKNVSQDNKDSTNKAVSNENSQTQSQKTNESSQNTKDDSSKTSNLITDQNSSSNSKSKIQENKQAQKDQNTSAVNVSALEKQTKNDENISLANSKDTNVILKNDEKVALAKDDSKEKSKNSSDLNLKTPVENRQNKNEVKDDKKALQWWQKLNESASILESFSYDQTSLSLTFKESMPLDVEVVLKLENLDSHEEKQISFKTTNGKVQNVLLTSSNLTSGKWKIKSFSFDKTYSHSPTTETTFDFKTNEKLNQERVEKIQRVIDEYQIKIKQNYKDKPIISEYALSNFDLNLNFKNLEIVKNSLKFDGSNLNQDLKSEKQMKITFEKVSENQANKTRKAHFKITTLDNLVFEKTLEWSYKTNKEYLDEFKNGSALWDDLQASLTSVFEKSLWHPYQLPKAKSKINTINLINDVSASFQGYDFLDDFNGSAKLKFKLQRGQEQRDITFTINRFLKVSLIDPLYRGNLRNSEFIVKASSNGYWLGQYYTAAEVFKHYSNAKSYWYATSSDGSPWLEFSWKDNTLADIYGFELLFWNNKDYYKKGSYKVEYKSNGNSEWKALENVEITSMPFEKDKRFIQEIVKIKKERISAVRIVFLKDKKPTYPSVFSLNPIVRTVF
ncbi:hypothetical protein [Mycoplasmopsis pulmonis]|uniref:hypothetical protein n=3 Tax=Mycoplasmopsis pulmonis TaxID=2107 RepID=UPI002ACE7AF0|nr:hypothetical protein [Mycoplasmopsis pulmonis]MDZ7293469.1 hypothetical protein [Mycoplasmopsis pulmonis]